MTPVFAAIKYPSHITPILLIPFSLSLSSLYVCGYKLIIMFLQSSDLIYFKIYTTLLVSSKVDLKCSSAIKVGFCLPFYETMRGRSIKLASTEASPHKFHVQTSTIGGISDHKELLNSQQFAKAGFNNKIFKCFNFILRIQDKLDYVRIRPHQDRKPLGFGTCF